MSPSRTDAIAAFADAHGLDSDALAALETLLLPEPIGEGPQPTWKPEAHPVGAAPPPTPVVPARYGDLGQLGTGGMGEVRRVHDRELNRTVAMKVLRGRLDANPALLARFREEAQVAAQLQHPGIVPIHDVGQLPDGRLYFTMKEVRGRTLGDAITEAHAAAEPSVPFRRLVAAFHAVCQALAYAHDRGVVHRDVKPGNVMLGDFGEVLLLDWGLARVLAEAGRDIDRPVTDRTASDALATRQGTVTGTPAYMAPEQARGDGTAIGPHTDVYALGAVLYHILTGVPPRQGRAVELVAAAARGDPVPPPALMSPLPVPAELEHICLFAMQTEPAARFPTAGELGTEIEAWLDGARKRDRALELVEEARAQAPEVRRSRARAVSLRQEAEQRLGEVAKIAPEEEKWPAWELEDEARGLERDADDRETRALQLVQSALSHAPELKEAHTALADHYHARHQIAEAAGDEAEARRMEAMLRAHDHFAAYLEGLGALTLVTDPPGARVEVHRFVENRRRLVPVSEGELGTTPLVEVPLQRGSYLLIVRAEGRAPMRYPVAIGRQEHWDGVPPDESEPEAVPLLRTGDLGEEEVYVPAGWFWSGGELEQLDNPVPLRRLWCHGFVSERHLTTNARYLAWLNWLVDEGRQEEADRRQPRVDAGPLFGLVEGRYAVRGGAVGDLDGRLPVAGLFFADMLAYAAWRVQRSGVAWRLPLELEWEKLARGVDRRLYPWGDHAEVTFSRGRAYGLMPAPVGSHPADVSLYGATDLAGNFTEATLDDAAHPSRAIKGRVDPVVTDHRGWFRSRGGGMSHSAWWCRADAPKACDPTRRHGQLGFRLVRQLSNSSRKL